MYINEIKYIDLNLSRSYSSY